MRFILITILLLLTIAFGAADELYIWKDEGLISSMDVVIVSCLENAQNIEHQLVCHDTFNTLTLDTARLNDSCIMSFADLDAFGCIDISAQAVFDRNNVRSKVSKALNTEQVYIEPRRILATQSWDGGWNTPSDTAYAVWILSQFKERYATQINDAMLWLKQHRDDSTKCWSTTPFDSTCSVYETSRTLAFLSFAGINDTHRIKADGQHWLESRQNVIESPNNWKLEVMPQSDGNCTIVGGTTTLANAQVMNKSNIYEFSISPTYDYLLNFSCSMRTSFAIFDHRYQNIFGYTFDEDEGFSFDYKNQGNTQDYTTFRFNPPCWSATGKWQYCNKETTLYSLVPITAHRQLAKDWFDGELSYDPIIGKFISTPNRVFDTALYLYAVDPSNTAVRQWLVYNQNNDGSWGGPEEKDKVLPTAMAILALENLTFPSSHEVLRDARNWFSSRTPLLGWDATKEDAVTFMILKENARPFLKLHESEIVEMSSTKRLHIVNPTHENIEGIRVEFSDGLKDKMDAVITTAIPAYRNTTLELRPKAVPAGVYSGIVSFFDDHNNTLLHVPVVFDSKVNFEIRVPQTAYVFGGEGDVQIQVTTVNDQLRCTIDWNTDAFDGIRSTNIGNTGPLNLHISGQAKRETHMVNALLNCDSRDGPINKPMDFTLEMYENYPFTFTRDTLRINRAEKPYTVTLRNLLDEEITIDLRLTEGAGLLATEDTQITIAPRKRAKVTLQNFIPMEVNVTDTAVLQASAFSHTDSVAINIDVSDIPPFSWVGSAIVWFFVLVALGGVGYAGYYYRREVMDFSHEALHAIGPKMPAAIRKYFPHEDEEEQEEEVDTDMTYYLDIVRIMKDLNKTDGEIKIKLKEEGLPEEQIAKIIASMSKSEELEKQIKHEDDIKTMLQTVADEEGDIFKKLRDSGYSEAQIKEAVRELETGVDEKEEELKKKSGLVDK